MSRPRQMQWRASAAAERRLLASSVALLLLIAARLAEGDQLNENHLQRHSGLADGGFDDLEDDSHAADSVEDRNGGGGLPHRRPDSLKTDQEENERDLNTVRALLAALDSDKAVVGHYRNISKGCSSRCSINAGAGREATECWLSTLAYFESVLVGLMRRFVTVTTNVAIWQHEHGVQLNFETMVAEAVSRLEALATMRVVDKNRPLSHDELQRIIRSLVHDVQSKTEAILVGREEVPRTLDCPRACEKHIGILLWLPMHWLFALSCLITVTLVAFIVGAIVVLDRRENTLELAGANADERKITLSNTSYHASVHSTK